MIPRGVALVRRNICERSKCQHVLNYADPCAECPEGHWRQYQPSECRGLGDKIAAVAQPIAGAIDAVLGTKIKSCGGCKKMQTRLNAGTGIIEAVVKRVKGE